MAHEEVLSKWLPALWARDTKFEVSLATVAGRLRAVDGWVARLHSASQHLLYYVAEGAFDACINDDVSRRIESGDLLWGARGASLRFSKRDGENLVVWRFRLEARDEQGAPLPFPAAFLHLQAARECQGWIERIVDEAAEPGVGHEARMRGLMACLLTEIVRHGEESGSEAGRLSRAQRETVRRLVAEGRGSPSPTDLARAVGLSPDYFSRCFHRTFGVSPRRFLLDERLRMAALRLLESEQNVSEIALSLGYRDVFLFSRQFKAHFGHSPSAYRAAHTAVQRL